jgi:hypothetical protein
VAGSGVIHRQKFKLGLDGVEMDFHKPLRLSEVVEAECSVLATGKRSVQGANRIDFTPDSVPAWLRDLVDMPLTDEPAIGTVT